VAAVFVGACAENASAQASTAPTANAAIRGHIADPAGALIPGAKVTLTNALGVALAHTTADASGSYAFTNLAAGSYIVQATVDGFAPFTSPTLQLAEGQSKRVHIAMAIESTQQSVIVTDDEGPTVSVDADSNASSVVLKDKDLDALSDDPDELSNELSALAGPSAGPNGGQIYIDGFTGGTLPPKSSIREIRINQNPFSAEFDRIGYGRIEILTKPGTDQFHARGFVQGNDNAFNTGNPFTKSIPAYHSVQYNANVSGALSKTASYFLSVEGRNNQDASIYTAYVPAYNSATGLYYIYDASGSLIAPTTGGLFNPTSRLEISPRLDIQLGSRNTLTTRFQYERSKATNNGAGSTTMPSAAYDSLSSEYALQFTNSTLINEHIATEVRGQFRRSITSTTPVSTTPTISVSGYLTTGGYSSQFSSDHTDHMELQDVTTLTAGTHTIKFGGWLRDNREAEASNSNFNGSFTFNAPKDYVSSLNGTPSASKLTYTTGKLAYRTNIFDAAAFVQDDWKFNRFLTLSGGLRFESQNHVNDHNDLAPRVMIAYALDGHKDSKQAKTVVRVGYGFFYDRFDVGSLLSIARNDGSADSQTQTVISNPACFNATSLSNISSNSAQLATLCTGSGASSSASSQINSLDGNYHSPYNEQLGTSIERQLSKVATLTATYIHTNGVHQTVTRNANAYLPASGTYYYNSTTGARPNSSQGIVDQTYSEAAFKQNQLIVNTNARFSPKFNLMGYYVLSYANGNTDTASNSWNLSQDYGRASFNRRNIVFLMGNYTAPLGITFNPFLVAQSGKSYNIVTNTDLTGDNFYNNRPAYATAANCSSDSARYVNTSFGCMDVTPDANAKLIPVNLGRTSALVAFNLRVSRAFGFGPRTGAPSGPNQGNRPQGPYMGGGPGGGGHGGGGRGPGGGAASTGHKYSLNLSAQALNLFNNIDYGTPSGSIVPTLNADGTYGPGSRFGKASKLAGGMFASPSSSAARRIFFQAAFNF